MNEATLFKLKLNVLYVDDECRLIGSTFTYETIMCLYNKTFLFWQFLLLCGKLAHLCGSTSR